MISLPHPDPFESLHEEIFIFVPNEQFKILLLLACTDEEVEWSIRDQLAMDAQSLGLHLDALVELGLIEVYRDGGQNVYYMTEEQCDDLLEFIYSSLMDQRNQTILNLNSTSK